MTNTKIGLSEQELKLVNNTEWILMKNQILLKARKLLENSMYKMKAEILKNKNQIPSEVLKKSAKISRGENYHGLPYLVLDYPRCFEKENIFAIRTLFWWGNFFSITLHLGGKYKKTFLDSIAQSIPLLTENDFSICISNDQWEHHFENTNYVKIKSLAPKNLNLLIKETPFIKIAKRFSLQQWNEAEDNLAKDFKLLIEILN